MDFQQILSQKLNSVCITGVYQMFDAEKKILYVGKAKNLKKRLSSYFQKTKKHPKTQALVSKISHIDVIVTPTETDALLLEQSLIKQQRPPYNILLRDDKSYPYIYLSKDDDFPRLSFHRGGKSKKGLYFGPYPNSSSVRESLNLLQKTFRVRQCEDSFFKNRSRPCLQYQINRCTAPCVDEISYDEYDQDVRYTIMFLEGKEETIVEDLARCMDEASVEQHYDLAAKYRDQISHLRRIQEQQVIEESSGDIDVLVAVQKKDLACVQMLCIRQGRVLGSRSYYPSFKLSENEEDILLIHKNHLLFSDL